MPVSAEPATVSGKIPWGKIAAGACVLACLFVLFRLLPVKDWLGAFQGWVQGFGWAGYVLFAIVYAACCVLFVPASVLTLGAGALYGLGRGTAVVLCGATLGATLSFLLARTALRRKVERMTSASPKFRALDRAIGKEGAKIVFLIRLAPVFPFTYINYVFGLTAVRTLPYVLATLLGMIPGTFAYVYLGSTAASVASGDVGSTRRIVQIIGVILAFVVTLFVTRVATRAVRNAGVDEEAGT